MLAGLGPAGAATPAVASHCAVDERVLYTCAFPRGIGSLCAGADRVSYRFGPRGRPAIDVASALDWSNVRLGDVRGQGGGHQTHVRISRGAFHYVVFEGSDGSLAAHPGRTYSGIAVLDGERDVTTLTCRGRSVIALDDPMLARHAGAEDAGGPFDMWY